MINSCQTPLYRGAFLLLVDMVCRCGPSQSTSLASLWLMRWCFDFAVLTVASNVAMLLAVFMKGQTFPHTKAGYETCSLSGTRFSERHKVRRSSGRDPGSGRGGLRYWAGWCLVLSSFGRDPGSVRRSHEVQGTSLLWEWHGLWPRCQAPSGLAV